MSDLVSVVILPFLAVYILIIIFFWKPKQKRSHEPSQKPKGKVTPDDLMEVLEFMKTHQIIDNKQYNQLIAKSMPFL